MHLQPNPVIDPMPALQTMILSHLLYPDSTVSSLLIRMRMTLEFLKRNELGGDYAGGLKSGGWQGPPATF